MSDGKEGNVKSDGGDSTDVLSESNISKKPMGNSDDGNAEKDSSVSDESSDLDDNVFQVECILDVREMKRKRYFKVRWHGYGPNDDTWEPESNLKQNPNIAAMIKAYMEKVQDTKPQLPAKRARKSNEPKTYVEESLSEDEDWFGIKPDEASREARRLYVADRIPTLTEKILSEVGPGVRVLRNHLRDSVPDLNVSAREARFRKITSSESTPSREDVKAKNETISLNDLFTYDDTSRSNNSQEDVRLVVNKEVKTDPKEAAKSLAKIAIPRKRPKKRQSVNAVESSSSDEDRYNTKRSLKHKGRKKAKDDLSAKRHPSKPKRRCAEMDTSKNDIGISTKVSAIELVTLRSSESEPQLVKDMDELLSKSADAGRKTAESGKRYSKFFPAAKQSSDVKAESEKKRAEEATKTITASAKLAAAAKPVVGGESNAAKKTHFGESKKVIANKSEKTPAKNLSVATAAAVKLKSTTDGTLKSVRFNSLDLPLTLLPTDSSLNAAIVDGLEKVIPAPLCLSQQQFEEAVMDGKVDIARAALRVEKERRPDVNYVDKDGRSLLHKVCEAKCSSTHTHCELIQLLVANGARMDVQEANATGQTPIHVTLTSRRICHLRKLLALCSPVNQPDLNDQPPLVVAFNCCVDPEFVSALLAAGATFQPAFRIKNPASKHLLKRVGAHQTRLQAAVDRARSAVFSNVTARNVSPLFVNPLHESTRIEHSFRCDNATLTDTKSSFVVLIGLSDFSTEKPDVSMWGDWSPVVRISINDKECRLLRPTNKFVYMAAPRTGANRLCIELENQSALLKGGADVPGCGGTLPLTSLKLISQVCTVAKHDAAAASGGITNGVRC